MSIIDLNDYKVLLDKLQHAYLHIDHAVNINPNLTFALRSRDNLADEIASLSSFIATLENVKNKEDYASLHKHS